MSDRVPIPKAPQIRKRGGDPSPAWGRDPDNGDLLIRCSCGLVLGLDGHTVAPNGDVMPSLWHDDNGRGCGWHVYGTFVGWATDPEGANYRKEPEP